MSKAQQGDETKVLGVDIVLETCFFSFMSKQIAREVGVLAESAMSIPFKRRRMFAKSIDVPVGGEISIRLFLRNRRERTILESRGALKPGKWYHELFKIWNYGQRSMRDLPLVGPSVEEALPDATQKVRLDYSLKVSPERSLKYKVSVRDTADPDIITSWEGEFLL